MMTAMLAFALLIVSPARSELQRSTADIYQECLSRHLQRIQNFDPYQGFGAWLGEGKGLVAEGSVEPEAVFNEIYTQNLWRWKGGVASGIGSSLAAVGPAWCALERVVETLAVESLLDAGVGDFRWMSHFLDQHPKIRFFIGVDVSSKVINVLRLAFSKDVASGRFAFASQNLGCGDQPFEVDVDLILLRDVLQHQTLAGAAEILRCLDRSGARMLLVSSFEAGDVNRDMDSLGAALSSSHVALRLPPFSLPEPLVTFPEYDHEEPKSLLLYKLPIGVERFMHDSLASTANVAHNTRTTFAEL